MLGTETVPNLLLADGLLLLMKELARPWIWLTIAILLFFCVPYFFAGTYEPLVLGGKSTNLSKEKRSA